MCKCGECNGKVQSCECNTCPEKDKCGYPYTDDCRKEEINK